jgi:hypothetical protein
MATLVASAGLSTQRNPNSTIKCIFILLFVIVAAMGIICCEHATKKHGGDADLVRKCMEQKGPMQVWKKPDGRFANVCQISDKVFGIMITDKAGKGAHEITSYIKEYMTKFSEVRDYLERMGAVRIKIY